MRKLGLEDAFVLTNGALVSLSRVKTHVILEMIAASESLIAFGAFVGSLFVRGEFERLRRS